MERVRFPLAGRGLLYAAGYGTGGFATGCFETIALDV